MAHAKITSFADFWPYYLREHARPETRALHYVGTSLLVVIGIAALVTGRWWLTALLPVAVDNSPVATACQPVAVAPRPEALARAPVAVAWKPAA